MQVKLNNFSCALLLTKGEYPEEQRPVGNLQGWPPLSSTGHVLIRACRVSLCACAQCAGRHAFSVWHGSYNTGIGTGAPSRTPTSGGSARNSSVCSGAHTWSTRRPSVPQSPACSWAHLGEGSAPRGAGLTTPPSCASVEALHTCGPLKQTRKLRNHNTPKGNKKVMIAEEL